MHVPAVTAVGTLPVAGQQRIGMHRHCKVRSGERRRLLIALGRARDAQASESGRRQRTECKCGDDDADQNLQQGEAARAHPADAFS